MSATFEALLKIANGAKFYPYQVIYPGAGVVFHFRKSTKSKVPFSIELAWKNGIECWKIVYLPGTFDTIDKAKNHLDKLIIDHGGILVDKLASFI